MDYLDRLEHNNSDFWEWLDILATMPDEPLFPEDFELFGEPSPAEQAVMDANAELLRLEFEKG